MTPHARHRASAGRTPTGLADGAAAYVLTSGWRNARLLHMLRPAQWLYASHHLDFRPQGEYIVASPSQVDGITRTLDSAGRQV